MNLICKILKKKDFPPLDQTKHAKHCLQCYEVKTVKKRHDFQRVVVSDDLGYVFIHGRVKMCPD